MTPDVEAVFDTIKRALAEAKLDAYVREDVGLEDGVVINVEGVEEVVCVSIQPEWDPIRRPVSASSSGDA